MTDGFGMRPISDGIILRQEVAPTTTAGGILLPEQAKKKPARGVVLAVGPGRQLEDGSRSQMQVSVGDTVIFAPYAPETVELDGELLVLVRESEIFGVVE